MDWAAVFPIRQIEAKQELGKSTKYRHHRTKFKDLSIIKVLTKLDQALVLSPNSSQKSHENNILKSNLDP